MNTQRKPPINPATVAESARKHSQWRLLLDKASSIGVSTGGLIVIIAVVLIMLYLIKTVLPLFASSTITQETIEESLLGQAVYLSADEYGETLTAFMPDGDIRFFSLKKQIWQGQHRFAGINEPLTKVIELQAQPWFLLITSTQTHLIKLDHIISYENNTRHVRPQITTSFSLPVAFSATTDTRILDAFIDDNRIFLMSETNNTLTVHQFRRTFGGLSLQTSWTQELDKNLFSAHFAESAEHIYLLFNNDEIHYLKREPETLKLLASISDSKLKSFTSSAMLNGRFSLLVGTESGEIHQVFSYMKASDNGAELKLVRSFETSDTQAITQIVPEKRRKGFIALDSKNSVHIFYTTSERYLLKHQFEQAVTGISLNKRDDTLIVQQGSGLHKLTIDNEHPEVSWHALWSSIWYEHYAEPDYIWQSSAATNDFEPKFSLMPLTFGTIKAALYAMLFSIPLAIGGAIFTAFFMTARMRNWVKPAIEVMEALPTVILGFLAGLWLAPVIEDNLAGVLSIFVLLPFSFIIFGLSMAFLPQEWRHVIQGGWQAALLIPIILIIAWLGILLGPWLDQLFFNGDLKEWISNEEYGLGITFDQRNALVVGLAMGFAVIPTIFSITEDAIHSVPKHLVEGSLALGASPWQTVVNVVLPTASPSIFSAVMIGFGRAVGETIIVLMATGNTPIMDMNIFEGMRTLSANIAVELPESEVGSSHFRILFLAALTLFAFTFVLNTLAELVRQRLRYKYASL